MLDLENFMKLLEDAMPSEDGVFSIDEKIMSKKAAKRRRIKAKRLAQKRAEEAKVKEQEKQAEEQETEKEPGTALIVYQEVDNEYEEISEDFTNLIQTLDQANDKHKKEIEQAMGIWKQAGEDSQCPEDVWNMLNTSINNYKNTVEQTLNSIDLEKLQQPELQILDRYLTGINGYIEKASQQIMAAKPNLVEADFKAPVVQQDGKLVTQTGTDVATTTGTALVPATGTAVATVDTTPLDEPEKQKDDKRKKKKLVSYKTFWDNFKTLKDALDALWQGLKVIGEAIKKGAKALAGLALQPISFLNDKLYAFLTSPLAKDIVKTFMYANPFTKMLFDGDFGKLNIGILDKVHNALSKVTQGPKKGDPTKSKPENYTQRKLPKSLDNKTLKELKKEFYNNRALVDLINVSYNHPEVKIQDKADLEKYVNQIKRAINTKNIEGIRSKFKSLIKTCDKICDYMDWVKPKDWQNLITKYLKARGNTKKEQDKIDKKRKSTPKTKEKDSGMSDEAIDKIVDKLAKKLQNQEAYTEERIIKLEKLLEEAEGDK